jgi:hypothetical protein
LLFLALRNHDSSAGFATAVMMKFLPREKSSALSSVKRSGDGAPRVVGLLEMARSSWSKSEVWVGTLPARSAATASPLLSLLLLSAWLQLREQASFFTESWPPRWKKEERALFFVRRRNECVNDECRGMSR